MYTYIIDNTILSYSPRLYTLSFLLSSCPKLRTMRQTPRVNVRIPRYTIVAYLPRTINTAKEQHNDIEDSVNRFHGGQTKRMIIKICCLATVAMELVDSVHSSLCHFMIYRSHSCGEPPTTSVSVRVACTAFKLRKEKCIQI